MKYAGEEKDRTMRCEEKSVDDGVIELFMNDMRMDRVIV